MATRMTNDEVRDWAVIMATALAFHENTHDYPASVKRLLGDFYAGMPHLTRESHSDMLARADA